MHPNDKPRQKSGFLLEELDGELMLYSIATTKIFALNQSAALIWQLCSGIYSVADISAALSEAYPENQAEIGPQVAQVLRQLTDHGTLEWM